jgi:histidyl-tRNA synthetase
MNQPSIPKGTRDFVPTEMARRNFIFAVMRRHFESFGYAPIETPSFENTATLTGKYGDEGDQLIFKILDNGDYLKDVPVESLTSKNLNAITQRISSRALRYDLTVPFARFVVMHRNEIQFPFRRYQIQPVWRADRPQKGRYREFFQCDADIIGTKNLMCEAELILLFDAVLSELKINADIRINNRKILQAIALTAGIEDRFMEMTIAIDKLDKIGADGVAAELSNRGFHEEAIAKIMEPFTWIADFEGMLSKLKSYLIASEVGELGMTELREVKKWVDAAGLSTSHLILDLTLARGLNYYTGAIFEVRARDIEFGSICGGGRYDNLTGVFGLPDVSGVGISFGADRIYDVMLSLGLFNDAITSRSNILLIHTNEETQQSCFQIAAMLRKGGVSVEVYADQAKLKKQLKFADDCGFAWVGIMGEDELHSQQITLRRMKDGSQQQCAINELKHFHWS